MHNHRLGFKYNEFRLDIKVLRKNEVKYKQASHPNVKFVLKVVN
jgi:hypothetical protein